MLKVLVFSLFGYFTVIGNLPPRFVQKQPEPSQESVCALPGPKNVHVAVDGGSLVQLAWDPEPEAAFFRVKVYKGDNYVVTHSKLVPSLPDQNSVMLDSLEFGALYFFSVYAVCSDGSESPKEHPH